MRSDGELVTGAQPHLGYLHRCAEKIGENVEWLQYLPYTDRYDYLAAMNNNLGYSMAVEALLGGLEIPRRAELIRIICAELNRIGSHLIAFGTYGLDIGAFTPFFYAFREREWMMALFEKICGARLTYSYIRIGGVFNDAPPGWFDEVAHFCDVFEEKWKEYYDLLVVNQIFVQRTANIGVIPAEMALDFGLTGPMLRGSGVDFDLRRDLPYSHLRRDLEGGRLRDPGGARARWARSATAGTACTCRVVEMMESIKIVRWCLDAHGRGARHRRAAEDPARARRRGLRRHREPARRARPLRRLRRRQGRRARARARAVLHQRLAVLEEPRCRAPCWATPSPSSARRTS